MCQISYEFFLDLEWDVHATIRMENLHFLHDHEFLQSQLLQELALAYPK